MRLVLAAVFVLCASPSFAGSVSLAGIISPLAAKAQEIVGACGSTVISAFRRGARVAGTGKMSLHASGQAIDIRGNPSCVARYLASWSGGASYDYDRVGHYHISFGGREHGQRFAHRRARMAKMRTRHAYAQ